MNDKIKTPHSPEHDADLRPAATEAIDGVRGDDVSLNGEMFQILEDARLELGSVLRTPYETLGSIEAAQTTVERLLKQVEADIKHMRAIIHSGNVLPSHHYDGVEQLLGSLNTTVRKDNHDFEVVEDGAGKGETVARSAANTVEATATQRLQESEDTEDTDLEAYAAAVSDAQRLLLLASTSLRNIGEEDAPAFRRAQNQVEENLSTLIHRTSGLRNPGVPNDQAIELIYRDLGELLRTFKFRKEAFTTLTDEFHEALGSGQSTKNAHNYFRDNM